VEILKANSDLIQGLVDNGFEDPFAVISSWEQAKQFVPQGARGKVIGVQNGERGTNSAVNLYDVNALSTTQISRDVSYSTWTSDKNGKPVEEKHVLKAGTDNMFTYVKGVYQGKAQLKKIQDLQEHQGKIDLQKAQTGLAKAETGKAAAETRLTDAQIKNMADMGVIIPENFHQIQGVELMPADQVRGELEKQGVKVPGNFDALYKIAHYQAKATTLPARTFNRGGNMQMDQQTGVSYISHFINPKWDEKNYETFQKLRNDIALAKNN